MKTCVADELLLKEKGVLFPLRTTDTRRLNHKIFAAQIQIPIPNKYLECGFKGLVFL